MSSELLQGAFESDVYSVGATLLKLTVLPPSTDWQPEAKLIYSKGLRRLLKSMVSVEPSSRPPLECVREGAASLYLRATLDPAQEALRLTGLANSNVQNLQYRRAAIMCAIADSLYFHSCPDYKALALNFVNWGVALRMEGRLAESAKKHKAAHAIYSHLAPDQKCAALNLHHWGNARLAAKSQKAASKYKAADAILSSLFPNDYLTACNLSAWAVGYSKAEKYRNAEAKFSAADAVFCRICPLDERAAFNLLTWAETLTFMGKRWKEKEAMAKLEAARAIFVSNNKRGDLNDCDRRIRRFV